MATFGGLNIIRENLVLYIDAANEKQYRGTPTSSQTVLDLTKNHTVQMLNGVVYNTEYLGGITFDGINDHLSIPFNASTMNFSLAQTIIMWIQAGSNSNTTRRNPYNQAYGGSGTITHEPSGIFNYYFGTHGGDSAPYVGRGSGFTVVPNELACIAVTRSQHLNVCNWYKNGTRITTGNAGGYAATNNGNSNILIGTGYTSPFSGIIYNVMVYNKFFTDDEVVRTYNIFKNRFGII